MIIYTCQEILFSWLFCKDELFILKLLDFLNNLNLCLILKITLFILLITVSKNLFLLILYSKILTKNILN